MVQTLTLNNGTAIGGCTTWMGIINNGTVSTDNARIEDADVAINIVGTNAKYYLTNTTFLNNKLSISAVDKDLLNCTIDQCSFDNTKLAPFSIQLPAYHIYFENVTNALILSADNNKPNIFKHSQIGIYCRNTDLTIHNSKFKDIGYTEVEMPNNIIKYGTGILCYNTSTVLKNIIVDKTAIKNGCTFANITDAIAVLGAHQTTIQNNLMEQCKNAVFMNNNSNSIVNISSNIMNDCYNGFNITRLNNAKYTINDNLFNMINANTPDAYTSVNYGYKAISLWELTKQNNFVQMHGNKINNTLFGIYIINLTAANATDIRIGGNSNNLNAKLDNTIYFNIPNVNLTQAHYGIQANNCVGNISITQNYIERGLANTSGLPQQSMLTGIFVGRSTNINVSENYTKNMGTDITFYGYCIGANIRCNKMERSWQGINFVSATITSSNDYGSTTDPTNNKWVAGYNTNGHLRIVGNFANSVIPLNWWHNNANIYVPSPHAPNVIIAKQTTNIGTACTFSVMADDSLEVLEDIIRDSTIYNENTAENNAYQDGYAFDQLHADSALMYTGNSNDYYMQQWYAAQLAGNLGRFASVDQYINAKNKQAAKIALLTVVDTTLMLQNARIVYDIYIEYYLEADSIVQLDSTTYFTLYQIAIQNAVTGGDAVYMARAMLQLDVEDDVSIFRKAKNNLQHTENVSLTIYPNPTNGKINLEYDVPVQSKAEIKIYNVLGTVVETYDLNNKGNLLSIELKNNLGNILFYRFYVNDTLIDKGKIIYIK